MICVKFVAVSVPCWGKAINTTRDEFFEEQYVLNDVSVPCWGKAINTASLGSRLVTGLISRFAGESSFFG